MQPQSEERPGAQSAQRMLESPEFKRLVVRRWRVSVILTVALFVLYYGYILLIGYDKALMSQRIGQYVTLGIPLGVGVIVLSWVLTVIYVVWANRSYDPAVRKLKAKLE
jgi:uncharacterized membrane protein (DUF485 family)